MAGIPAAPAEVEQPLAVPAEPEEPSVPAPEPEEEAPAQPEEGEESPEDQLAAFLAENPDIIDRALGKAPEEVRAKYAPPEEQLTQSEVQQTGQSLSGYLGQAYGKVNLYVPENVQRLAEEKIVQPFIDELANGSEAYLEGKADAPKLPDARTIAGKVTGLVQAARTAQYEADYAEAYTAALYGVMRHPIYRQLSPEDKAALVEATNQESLYDRVAGILYAALNAKLKGPPQNGKPSAEEVKVDAKLEQMLNLAAKVGTGAGRRVRAGAQPPDTRTVAARLADPKTPISELEQLLARTGGR